MAVYRLDDELWFPDPRYGEADGLVAVGGDLSVDRLLLAYSNGFFPWFAYRYSKAPHWYCPLDRFVIFPHDIHVSHSMRQLMRRNLYEVTFNQDFEGVIRGCAQADMRDEKLGAWLGEDMIRAYIELYHQGFAASVEVWEAETPTDSRKLVGGLYGVNIGKGFFGESMFSLVPSASKLALIHLAQIFARHGGKLIDCQFETPHLKSMGGCHITYEQYMEILDDDEP